ADNVDLVNEMLEAFTDTQATPTAAQLQSLADSAVAIAEALATSDGERAGGLQLDASDYQALGLSHVDTPLEASLLNELINTGSGNLGADYASIEASSLAIERLVEFVANGTLTPSLSLSELASLGVTEMTAERLDEFLATVLETFTGNEPLTLVTLNTVANRVLNDIDLLTEDARAGLLADALGIAEDEGADDERKVAIETAVDHIIRTVANQQTTLTVDDFVALGMTDVVAAELAAIADALAATPRDGSGVTTVSKVEQIVNALRLSDTDADVVAAVSKILDPNAAEAPGVPDYVEAGVFGVDDDNLAAIDAFVQAAMNGNNGATRSQLQETINAVNALRAQANGDATTPATLTVDDYAAMDMGAIQSADELTLINSMVGGLPANQVSDPATLGQLVAMTTAVRAGQPVTSDQLTALTGTPPSATALMRFNQALAHGARPATSSALQRVLQTAENIANGAGRTPAAETLANGNDPDLLPGEIRHRLSGVIRSFTKTISGSATKVISNNPFELRLSGDCAGQPCRIRTNAANLEVLEIITGGSARVSGRGFFPGSDIDLWIFSDPVLLGTVTVEDDGGFEATEPLVGIAPGNHTLQANGVSLDGELRSVEIGITVVEAPDTDNGSDPSNPSGPTPSDPLAIPTGLGWGWLVLVLALMALGLMRLGPRARGVRQAPLK
ncbi:MAG: hypothetical protein RI542_08785, partial [Wenzhouxiangella sp.]|nr:hypothetical protein [Wenzhouxiangella sp.]